MLSLTCADKSASCVVETGKLTTSLAPFVIIKLSASDALSLATAPSAISCSTVSGSWVCFNRCRFYDICPALSSDAGLSSLSTAANATRFGFTVYGQLTKQRTTAILVSIIETTDIEVDNALLASGVKLRSASAVLTLATVPVMVHTPVTAS